MQLAFRLITTLVLFAFFAACQRPYALFQRTPGEPFRVDIRSEITRNIPPTDTIPETIIADIQPVEEELLEASAAIPNPLKGPFESRTRLESVVSLRQNAPFRGLGVSAPGRVDRLGIETDQQPRPKARSNREPPRKTFREWLGLKPRPQLNWWQRISWKIKASVFVILIAVVFAILNINTLAIIFGIIGAVLLVSGLRKTFKVRRPWF